MKVNIEKTKVIVFRRGGVVKKNEHWTFDNDKVEVVSSYKYLGVTFAPFSNWSATQKTQVAQAEKTFLYSKNV